MQMVYDFFAVLDFLSKNVYNMLRQSRMARVCDHHSHKRIFYAY